MRNAPSESSNMSSSYLIAIHTDISNKGIAGRAILIDWYRWALKKGRNIDAMTAYSVPFAELIEVLKDQGLSKTSFQPGDILLFRFGYIHQYEIMPEEKRAHLDDLYKKQKPENIGIQPSEELLKFLWEKKISAVAADTRSFEVWPCTETQWHLHEWLLAGWGMPIGELFYLEELSRSCDEGGRYTFFFTSSPMNVSLSIFAFFHIPYATFGHDRLTSCTGAWCSCKSA